jgi:predicted aspartyl protease
LRTHFLPTIFVTAAFLYPTFLSAQSVALVAGHSREIPFQLVAGYFVVVEGSIGGSDHLKFIIDTGTTHTCIDRKLAERLNLPLEPSTIFYLDKKVKISSTRLPNLDLGPLRAENLRVNVSDLSRLERSATYFAAILGLDLLESFPFQIDYEHLRVTFGISPLLAESVSIEPIPWLPIVPLDFNHSKVHLFVDTGARNVLFFSDRLHASSYDWRIGAIEIWWNSAIGQIRARKAVFRGAAFGSDRGDHEIYLIHTPPNYPLASVDGLLSPVALGIRQIGFDFDRHIVTWNR